MSFRKRNVVLSSPLPSRLPRTQTAASDETHLLQANALQKLDQDEDGQQSEQQKKESSPQTPQTQQIRPHLPRYTVSRPEWPPEHHARLVSGKQRLRALLDQQREERRRQSSASAAGAASVQPLQAPLGPGARPSPLDGRPITSSGTESLDGLLSGFGGLLLGHSLLVEEQGTTDFAGSMLRAYASEGLVQGHHVHVLGAGPGWQNQLPGLASSGAKQSGHGTAAAADKMKIAWRYEALAPRSRPAQNSQDSATASSKPTFCHTFDLTKRLPPADVKGMLHAQPLPNPLALPSSSSASSSPPPEHTHSPLRAFLSSVRASLATTPPSTLHRIVLPNFLAPTLYALDGWSFPYVLAMLLALRSLLRQNSRRLTAMISLSTSLFERGDLYVGQLEDLCDTVVELIPLPPGPPSAMAHHDRGSSGNNSSSSSGSGTSGASSKSSRENSSPVDKMQGWFKAHKLQVYSEMGGNGASPQGTTLRENYCFSVSASRGMLISLYSLPPIDDNAGHEEKPTKEGIEF